MRRSIRAQSAFPCLVGMIAALGLYACGKHSAVGASDSEINSSSTQSEPPPAPILYTTDAAIPNIPTGDTGVTSLLKILEGVSKPPEKGDYETTAQFKGRLENYKPDLSSYKIDQKFVIIADLDKTYDADKGELTLKVDSSSFGNDDQVIVEEPAVKLSEKEAEKSTYVGENEFGNSRIVTRTTFNATLLFPIAPFKNAKKCDFQKGKTGAPISAENVNLSYESFVRWACGDNYYGYESPDHLQTFSISLSPEIAKSLSQKPIEVAYIISFDHIPNHGSPAVNVDRSVLRQPNMDHPQEVDTMGTIIVANLHKLVVYVPGSGPILYVQDYEAASPHE